MYVQCKVYVQLWKRLKAYNRVIYVQNYPDTSKKSRLEKPDTEYSSIIRSHHTETTSSNCTETENVNVNILHIWHVFSWRFGSAFFTIFRYLISVKTELVEIFFFTKTSDWKINGRKSAWVIYKWSWTLFSLHF